MTKMNKQKSIMLDKGWTFKGEKVLVYNKRTHKHITADTTKWQHTALCPHPVGFRAAVKIAFPPLQQLQLFFDDNEAKLFIEK